MAAKHRSCQQTRWPLSNTYPGGCDGAASSMTLPMSASRNFDSVVDDGIVSVSSRRSMKSVLSAMNQGERCRRIGLEDFHLAVLVCCRLVRTDNKMAARPVHRYDIYRNGVGKSQCLSYMVNRLRKFTAVTGFNTPVAQRLFNEHHNGDPW